MTILRFDTLESTNKHCEALDLASVEDFTCYWALSQSAGIGQRGNHWHSAPGQNLTFSLVLHPQNLQANRQFLLTQALALAVLDFLSTFNIQFPVLIKWPNDIYADGRKICGTLVSTHLHTNTIASAVCGIGLNINQREFPTSIPNPTSLTLLTGHTHRLEPLLLQLLDCIKKRYNHIGNHLQKEYLAHLMNLGTEATYRYGSELLRATITGVDPLGHLLLTTADGRHLCCAMKEISLL